MYFANKEFAQQTLCFAINFDVSQQQTFFIDQVVNNN